MPEMITVRCPRCGKKLLFSPFDNYKKATLECPGCHYTGLVETYPEISEASQSHGSPSQAAGQSSNNRTYADSPAGATSLGQRNPKGGNDAGIRDLDETPARNGSRFRKGSKSDEPRSKSQKTQLEEGQDQPSGFALKFPWVISGLALAIILLYVCLQFISTNEVI